MNNTYKIETSVNRNGPWLDTGLIEPEPESARLTATRVWSSVPEERPFVRAIRDGSDRPVFVAKAGRFRKSWSGCWMRIIDRNMFGWRQKP